MNRSTTSRTRPTLATIVAFLALFVALGTSSHAGGLFTGKNIKNESVTGKDVKNLTGDDLDERTLDVVRSAQIAGTAQTAESVGTLEPSDLLTTSGCQPGKLHGTARVLANGGGVPATYTQQVAWIDSTYNCSGAAVQVRRESGGLYFVKFLQNDAGLAITDVRATVGNTDICTSADRVTTPGIDLNAFKVQVVDCGAGTIADADFTLMVP